MTFFLIRALLPFGLVFLLAPDAFITALLGERWLAAGKVLRVLAAYAVVFPIVENLKVLFYALGRPEVVSKARIAQIAVFVPLLFLLVNLMGIVGAAYAILVSILVTYAVFLFLLRGEVEFSLVRTVGMPMAFAGLTYLAYSVLPQPHFGNRIMELLFSSCIIFSIFGACEMLFERQIIFKHIRYIRTTLGSPTSDELEATRDRER